ncbi:MAG: LPXTG cell wall anchor domain-containing protein [Clostridiales bacterium]|nr:LPXTG cell wall anchor domain-containing protein [Clostridiales bacterium]
MNRKKRRWVKLFTAPLLAAVLLLATFIHTGNVQAADTADAYRCSITIPVQVTVLGDTAPQENYTFTIKAETDGAPMPADDTLLVAGTGTGSFEPITYTVPGDYIYRITQTAGTTKGMTYDASGYQVTVRVVNGENGGLAAEIWAVKNDSNQKVDSIAFHNQYDDGQAPAVTPAPADPGNGSGNDTGDKGKADSGSGSSGKSSSSRAAKTGDSNHIFLYSGLMAIALLGCGLFVLTGRKERRKSA